MQPHSRGDTRIEAVRKIIVTSAAENTLEGSVKDYENVAKYLYREIRDVQRAFSLYGRFLYTNIFFKNFYSHPNICLFPFGRYIGRKKGVCLCHVTTGEEVNSYEETFSLR